MDKVNGDRVMWVLPIMLSIIWGDIVFVELPELDEEVAQGESMGVIESVKAVAPFLVRFQAEY